MGSIRVQAWHSPEPKEVGGVWCLVVNSEVESEECGDKTGRRATCQREDF